MLCWNWNATSFEVQGLMARSVVFVAVQDTNDVKFDMGGLR